MKVIICILAAVCFVFGLHSQNVAEYINIPNPDDMEVDRFGNLWVNYRVSMTSSEHRLARVSPDGLIADVLTENYTLGMFGVNDSIIWIGGEWGPESHVFKYDHFGNKLDSVYMPFPTSIILDSDGTWYVTQNALGRLTKVYTDNSTQILAAGLPLNFNLALARDENGIFYTCNLGNGLVIRIDPTTGAKTVLASLPAPSNYNLGFLTYHEGYLYVPSYSQHCVFKVDTSGVGYAVYAGTIGVSGDEVGQLELAQFNVLTSVVYSITGDTMFISDAGNNKIKILTASNDVTYIEDNENSTVDFRIYPNPGSDTIIIELLNINESITKIEILSIEGKVLSEYNKSPNMAKPKEYYSVVDVLPGKYFVRITTSKGQMFSKAILKM